MRIDRIKLYHLRMPLQNHFETSFGRIYHRECVLIEMFSEGITGYGECVADRNPGYTYETTGTAWHILSDFLIPAVLHQDVHSSSELQNRLERVRGHPMAKAGLELAFWDLLGKANGHSLKEMLGGEHNRVKVGVSVGLQESPKKLVEVVGGYLDQGYQRVKIKIKPGRDLGDAQAVRESFPNLHLQVDANSAYTLETAEKLLSLDGLDLLMIEQPLAIDDLWDHHFLQERINTPLCLDESIRNQRHARQAIGMGACKIINIKPGRVGGLSEAIAIHDLCMQQDIPVWCGGMLETGVGRAANLSLASLSNFTLPGDISATDRYYQEDITDQRFLLNPDSTIDVPDSSGLGITINRQRLEKATLSKQIFK